MTDLDPQRFEVVKAEIETRHRIIAALKVQRWEVLKWAVAINFSLVTAWIALGKQASLAFAGMGAVVAIAVFVLISHYNDRARGARDDLHKQYSLLEPVITYSELRAPKTYDRLKEKSYFHDGLELAVFAIVLIGIAVIVFVITTIPI